MACDNTGISWDQSPLSLSWNPSGEIAPDHLHRPGEHTGLPGHRPDLHPGAHELRHHVPADHSGRAGHQHGHRLNLRYRRTDNGKKIATSTSGHSTASSTE